jgi:competence protein ComEC
MLRLKTILQSSHVLLILCIVSIIISFIICNIKIESKYNIDEKEIEGILIDSSIDGNKYSFIIKGKEKVKCTYYIQKESDLNKYKNIKIGTKLRLKGTLSIPNNNTVPNTFNYKKYLYYKHINYILNVDSISIESTNINILYRIKNYIKERINTYQSKAYLSTFILGDKSYLDDEIYSKYQESGILHIFAISGMHISLLVAIILKLLKRVKDDIKYPIIIIFLLLYIFITSISSSILRSSILFTIIYLNKRFDFNLETIQSFYITIMIVLIIDPFRLYDVGFIYSSVISYFLIRYSFIIKGNYLISILKVSILAFLVSLPITINMNYEINILSIFNNLLVVPLISLFIYPLSLITFIIKPLDIIFFYITNIFEYISKYFLVFNVVIPKLNIVVIIFYYIFIYIFLNTYNKKLLLIIVLLLTIYKYLYILDNNTYIYYLDVGQGDSALIKYKDKSILIDTGGKVRFKEEEWKKKKEYLYTGNNIKFFKSIGISNIDYLILTHGDYDHMGEATNLIEHFNVKNVIFNCGSYNNLEGELINKLNEEKIKYNTCLKELNVNNYKLYFLQTKEYDNENDNSNVIYLQINNYKFLFMGDASTTTEKEILNKYNLTDIDVLKVGHHGSNTSSSKEFINSIKPKYSIISDGKNNRYGHPNKEVLDNLKNSKIYRTDQDGSIIFKIENNKLRIETCSL